MPPDPVGAAMRPRVSAVAAVLLLVMGVFLVVPSGTASAGPAAAPVSIYYAGVTTATCLNVLTCVVLTTNAAATFEAIVIAEYNGANPSAVAVHLNGCGSCGVATSSVVTSTAGTRASFIYDSATTTAGTYRTWVNFTAAEYYTVTVALYLNAATASPLTSGTASATGTATTQPCSPTLGGWGEMVVQNVVFAASPGTITPFVRETAINTSATTTDVVYSWVGDNLFQYQSSAVTVQTTTANAAYATTCAGILPAYSSVVGPPEPSVLTCAANGVGALAASWSATQNLTVVNYTLAYNSADAGATFPNRVSEGSALWANLTGLALNTTYYLVVWSWVSGAQGPSSNVAVCHTQGRIPPVVVAPVVSVVGYWQGLAAFTWAAAANVSVVNYSVRVGATYGTWTGGASLGTATSGQSVVNCPTFNDTCFVQVLSWTAGNVRGPVSNVAVAYSNASWWYIAPAPTPLPAPYQFPWGVDLTVDVFVSLLAGCIGYLAARRALVKEGYLD
jgi:hypothetical protein